MKDLVQIIRDNPGAVAMIDNDDWALIKCGPPPEGFEKWEHKEQAKWHSSQELACADDGPFNLGDGGFGSGDRYGGDILQACAVIAGIKIESV